MSRPQGVFNLGGSFSLCKNESQVGGTFRPCENRVADSSRNFDFCDASNMPCVFNTVDRFKQATHRNGNHHDARSKSLALPGRDVFADRMAKNQFLKTDQVRMV